MSNPDTPVEVFRQWMGRGSYRHCPRCMCCSARLCEAAIQQERPCQSISDVDHMDLVAACPCAPSTSQQGDGQ